jgi:hypothetical protein
MSVPIPKWLAGPESCISCNGEAKLVSYRMNIDSPETCIEVGYKCSKCGYITTFRYTGSQRIESYLSFIESQVKAGIIKKIGDGVLE